MADDPDLFRGSLIKTSIEGILKIALLPHEKRAGPCALLHNWLSHGQRASCRERLLDFPSALP